MHIKAWAGSMMFLEITDICSFTSPVSTWPFKLLTYWDRYFIFIFIYMNIHEPLIPSKENEAQSQASSSDKTRMHIKQTKKPSQAHHS